MFSCTLSWHVIFPLHLAELIRAANLTFAGTKTQRQSSSQPQTKQMRPCMASFELIVLAETFRFSSGWNRRQTQTSLPYRWNYFSYHCSLCLKSRGNFYWRGVWAYLEVLKKEEKNQAQQMLHEVCCKMCPMSNVQNKWAVSFFSSIDAAPSEQLCWGGDVTGQHGK